MQTYIPNLSEKPGYDLHQHLLSLAEFFAQPSQPNIAAAVGAGYWNDHDADVYFCFNNLAQSFYPLRVNKPLLRGILFCLEGVESMEEINPDLSYRFWRLPFRPVNKKDRQT